jgi:hypothetical protein
MQACLASPHLRGGAKAINRLSRRRSLRRCEIQEAAIGRLSRLEADRPDHARAEPDGGLMRSLLRSTRCATESRAAGPTCSRGPQMRSRDLRGLRHSCDGLRSTPMAKRALTSQCTEPTECEALAALVSEADLLKLGRCCQLQHGPIACCGAGPQRGAVRPLRGQHGAVKPLRKGGAEEGQGDYLPPRCQDGQASPRYHPHRCRIEHQSKDQTSAFLDFIQQLTSGRRAQLPPPTAIY